jgi:hypothetical protein
MRLSCISLSSSIFLALPRGGSHKLLSLYGCACLSSLMSHWLLLLCFYFVPFIISPTSMLDSYPLALHYSLFTVPLEGIAFMSGHILCFPLIVSLHCLCSKHGTLSHSTHSLHTSLLCLSLCSSNHERVVHLVYFCLFFRICGLFMKKTLC